MKKILSLALAVLMLLSLFTVSISAAQYTGYADELKTAGLFLGTDKGFDLDRTPTRVEAAVMLVRMLGKENAAKTANLSHPFDDVPSWAGFYVGYLYENKLANGKSATKFGSTEPCTDIMYLTFTLRALGYSDAAGGDFSYADAVKYAKEIKLIPENFETDAFMRDHCVAVMYNALFFKLKGTGTTLLEKLVSENAVKADVAGAIKDKKMIYEGINKLSGGSAFSSYSSVTSSNIKIGTDPALTGGIAMTMEIKEKSELSSVTKDGKTSMSLKSTQTMFGAESVVTTYLKDGWIYTDDGTNKIKTKAEAEASDIQTIFLAESTMFDLSKLSTTSGANYSLIKSIKKETASTGYIYTITVNDDAFSTLSESMGMNELGVDVKFSDFAIKYYTDKDENFVKMEINALSDSQNAKIELSIITEITAKGDSVSIAFPDFSNYVEVTE